MKLKKILAATLAATMVMSSAMTVCASENYGASDSGYGSSGSGAGSGDESTGSGDESTGSGNDYSSAGTGTSSTDTGSSGSSVAAPSYVQSANAPITVAGSTVRTTIAGGYAATSVQGAAVITPLAQVKANLGLKDGEAPAITIYDTDPAKSPAAIACVNAALGAMGLSDDAVVAMLNIDLYAKKNGKVITLEDGSVALVAGLPKNADTTKTYSVICVQPRGVVTILEDLDTNPKTVTIDVQAGIGTYAIVAR